MQKNSDFQNLPLQGVRVLDFGRYIAGPYCAALLADFGADVIRVEKLNGSEDRYLMPVTESGDGALFLQMNRNKRSIALNPTSVGGKKIVQRLIATADVVVANLPQPTLEKMGLSYSQLREIKPDIILTTASAFGDQGEWANRVGFDSVAQAMSGAAYLSGNESLENAAPSRSQASWVDFGTALNCAFGTAMALMKRSQSGDGQQVSGSLLATAISVMNAQLIEQDLVAPNRQPLGNTSAGASPVGMFETKNGWVSCHVVGQALFDRVAKLINKESWLSDPRFSSDPLRGENRDTILNSVQSWCLERSLDDVLEAFAAARIPAAPVLTPQQALDHPAVSGIDLLQPVNYEGLKKPAKISRPAVTLSSTPTDLNPPPLLGEDTQDILISLGFSNSEIETFKHDKSI